MMHVHIPDHPIHRDVLANFVHDDEAPMGGVIIHLPNGEHLEIYPDEPEPEVWWIHRNGTRRTILIPAP